jgi:regulator of protease activity HflC (stomatin/prohibitin superfamily)
MNFIVYLPAIVLLAAILFSAVKILREYERGVVFQLGDSGR